MPLYTQYTGRHRDDFATLTDLQRNYKITVGEHFNFAYDCLDRLAAETPDARAIVWVADDKTTTRTLTFAQLKQLTDKTASYLHGLGVTKGDKVMLVLKRHLQFWPTLLALHKLGAVTVPATHLLTVKDYCYRLKAADISTIITTPDNNTPTTVDAAESENGRTLRKLVVYGHQRDGWHDFDAGVEAASADWSRETVGLNDNSDMMLLAFSSGTTGYPKMVWHDFTYPLGHILTGCFWHRVEENGLHFTISDTGWLKSMWGKAYGQWLGGSAIFVYDFEKFSARDILDMVAQHKVTTFCAPPTMYRYMIKEDLSGFDLSALKHCTTAGEALNPEVFAQWQRQTKLKIFEGFGQSETTLCCMTMYPFMQPRLGSMGLPAPGYDLYVADEQGNRVEPGVTGEIVIAADRDEKTTFGLFSGYYNEDERTDEVWHDGLYHTGDTAYTDEMGFLWYVGRTDDVIKSSGYRIGPFEVESAMMEHPAVLEVAVTGVPDPDRGMVVKATVVLANGYTASDALTKELQDTVKRNTAPYKYPRIVTYVDALPKTISGKIRRVEIRTQDGVK